MKDYYYILGLSSDASTQEIRVAYKKLSVKFHPDKNSGDKFFEDHFKEIQEAYAVLGKPEKRAKYDRNRMPMAQRRSIDVNRPIIQDFNISKKHIHTGDLVTLTWKVIHADKVNINVLGDVLTQGTKTIRLKQLGDAPALNIVLKAINSQTRQISEKQILVRNRDAQKNLQLLLQQEKTIKEVDDRYDYQPSPTPTVQQITTTKATKPTKQTTTQDLSYSDNQKPKNDIVVYIVVAVIIVFIIILAFFVYRLNGLS